MSHGGPRPPIPPDSFPPSYICFLSLINLFSMFPFAFPTHSSDLGPCVCHCIYSPDLIQSLAPVLSSTQSYQIRSELCDMNPDLNGRITHSTALRVKPPSRGGVGTLVPSSKYLPPTKNFIFDSFSFPPMFASSLRCFSKFFPCHPMISTSTRWFLFPSSFLVTR